MRRPFCVLLKYCSLYGGKRTILFTGSTSYSLAPFSESRCSLLFTTQLFKMEQICTLLCSITLFKS